jgi:alpha-tubulin suppressor-like RCC1 family protein
MPSAQQQQTHITTPQVLKHDSLSIKTACCGAESSHIFDINGNIHSTGWNEHGNLAIVGTHDGSAGSDCDECSMTWVATSSARAVAPPPSNAEKKLFAAGGAHLITMTI